MFVSLAEDARLSFKDNTLVVPGVSVGNIGQLACDLLLYNSGSNFQKVGYFRSRNVAPVVGNDAYGDPGTGDISTALEIYQNSSKKITIIQQRSRVILGRARTYAVELVKWAASESFAKIIILAAADSGFWAGDDVVYRKFFYTTRSAVDAEFLKIFSQLGVNPLSEVRADSIELFKGESTNPDQMIFPAARAGLLNKVHDACQEMSVVALGIVLFCKEGYNVEEAISMATMTNTLLDIIPVVDSGDTVTWKAPPSWRSLMEGIL